MNREIQRLARRNADQQKAQIADRPTSPLIATVTGWSGGVLTVTWRGSALTATGRHAAYTPAIGDVVTCDLIDNQLIVRDRIV